jgi:hypothetical protein
MLEDSHVDLTSPYRVLLSFRYPQKYAAFANYAIHNSQLYLYEFRFQTLQDALRACCCKRA